MTWYERQADCKLALKVAGVAPDRREVEAHTIATNVGDSAPAIGWNGREFVVVWQRGDVAQLEGARIAPDGTPIDTEPMPLTIPVPSPDYYTSESAIFPALRWMGSEWLLLWQALQMTYIPLYPDPPPVSLVRTRRIARDLHPAGGEQTIAKQAWYPLMDAHEPIVVWLDPRGTVSARIAGDGSTVESVISTVHAKNARTFACSAKECAVSINALLLRLTHDGSSVAASQTLPNPIFGLTSDGSSFLAITAAGHPPQLFAAEVPPLAPRRRIVR